MARLTAKDVENKRAGAERREIPDSYLRGLYLIVQPTGAKSWAVRYRLGGKSHKHTIGAYPVFDLKTARDEAAKVLRSVSEGRGPKQARAGSVSDAVEQFLERHARKTYRAKTLYEATRRLQLYVTDPWGDRKLDSVTRADVRAVLDKIEAPVTANRVHSIVRKFFGWCVENDLLANSPVAGIKRLHKETARDRVLTDDELKAVWRAAEKVGYPFGSIIQLLILTGQRRGEVGGMQWAELAGDVWSLPRERVKNDRRHEVPLSRQAMAIIERSPRIGDKYVFTLDGAIPYSGFRTTERLDAGIAPWTVHDLRRTAASGLARLGVSLVVIEKILNHVGGSLAGIVGVYQRHEYAAEKREALQRWADHVERLVAPTN
jgi:integrase